MVFHQPHIAERRLQAFTNDPGASKPDFIHAREAIRRQTVPASVDDEHSDARYRQDRLSTPFFDKLRRHHREASEPPSGGVCEDAAKGDQRLSCSTLRNDGGCDFKDEMAAI